MGGKAKPVSKASSGAAKGLSCQQLADKAGMEVHTVRRWLEADGLRPVRLRRLGKREVPYYDEHAAMKVILPHKRKVKSRSDGKWQMADGKAPDSVTGNPENDPAVDPETGLSWHQAELREKALGRRRANERAKKLESEEIMLTADHHTILAAVVGRLEQIPGKAGSELGLSPQQVIGLRRMLDEARESAAKDIEQEGTEGTEKEAAAS